MEQTNIFEFLNNDYKIKKPIRLIELFAGIGSQAKALERLGANFEHYKVVEFDKYAIKSYNAIHGTNFETSDVTQIHAKDLEIVETNKYEYILTYSFPCQDLSLAGLGKGMEKGSGTRSGLLWEVERILNECDELPQILLMENVIQVHGKKNKEHFDEWIKSLEKLGYSNFYQDLNAKDYGGIPQNRNRCFMISVLGDGKYNFPKPIPLELKLKDMLEDEVDEKYYLSEKMINYILDNNDAQKGTKWEGRADNDTLNSNIAHTLSCRGAGGSQRAGVSNFIVDDYDGEIKVKDLKLKIKKTVEDNNAKFDKCVCLNSKGGRNGVEGLQPSLKDRIYDSNGIATCCTTSNFFMPNYTDGLRIRKLTPKECWRLMGFDDEDFEKASAVNSDSQLFKQSGNSIVVQVLEAIFKQLL